MAGSHLNVLEPNCCLLPWQLRHKDKPGNPSLQEADPGPKDGLSVGPQGIILPSGESNKFGIIIPISR